MLLVYALLARREPKDCMCGHQKRSHLDHHFAGCFACFCNAYKPRRWWR